MKSLLTIVLITASTFSFTQTDIIEMRSRNASLMKYERVSTEIFDRNNSNFGLNPELENMRESIIFNPSNTVLDSVNWISDSVSILYTNCSCPRNLRECPHADSIRQPEADTVFNHPLFKNNHSLDSIKSVINSSHFDYKTSDSIKFIGFDNGQQDSNSNTVQPVEHKRKQRKNSFGWELLFMIVTPIAFLIGMNRIKIVDSVEK